MNIASYNVTDLPPDLTAFWKKVVEKQDPIGRLVRSPEWYEMMGMRRDAPQLSVNSYQLSGREEGKDCCRLPGAGVVVGAKGEDGQYRLVLPLLSSDRKIGISLLGKCLARKDMRILGVCGGDLVEKEAMVEDVAGVLKQINEELSDVDAVWLNHVASEDRLSKIRRACAGSGDFFFHRVASIMPHYRLVLPETIDECMSLRSKTSVKKIAGRERAMSRDVGDCSLVEIRREEDWLRFGDKIEEMMNTTWQANVLGHKFSLSDMKQVAEKGWLRSFLLTAGGQAVAFALCYQGMGTLIYEKIGYDRAFSKYSPGTILLYRLLDRIYENDTPKYVDFGEGEAEYKQLLANDVISVSSCMLVRKRLDLKTWFFLSRLCGIINGAARSIMRGVGLLKVLRRKKMTR